MNTDSSDAAPKPPQLSDADQRKLKLFAPGEAMNYPAPPSPPPTEPVSPRQRPAGARGTAARDPLRLEAPPPAVPPLLPSPGHGRLLEAHEVALEFYHRKRSPRWVLENLRHCRAKIPGRVAVHWESLVCAELGLPFPRSGS